jgi:hypothetical protein
MMIKVGFVAGMLAGKYDVVRKGAVRCNVLLTVTAVHGDCLGLWRGGLGARSAVPREAGIGGGI